MVFMEHLDCNHHCDMRGLATTLVFSGDSCRTHKGRKPKTPNKDKLILVVNLYGEKKYTVDQDLETNPV